MMDKAPRSILVIKPSSFGDVIHTLPAVAFLKRTWPEARLSWVINPEWVSLLEGNPDVAHLILFPRQNFRGWKAWHFRRWCRETIAPLQPDLAVDFQGLLRSAWIGRASQPRCLVGMSDAREGARWFYKRTVNVPCGVHAVERYLAVARRVAHHFGVEPFVAEGDPEVFIPPGTKPDDQQSWSGDYVLLHPFSRGQGKSLTSGQVHALCRLLAPRQVLLAGRRGKHEVGVLPGNCVDLLDRTSLAQFIWLTRHASAVITVDSGPSHLAAALRRPLVAIHTWSDPRRVGPYNPEAWVWKNGRLLPVHELAALPDAFFRRPASPLRQEDIAAIAGRAISLSGSCA